MTELPPRDPVVSEKLQILATEHWSLLATRSLIYQESFGRVNMFLAILSGAVIALALVAQADRFGAVFISIAIFMLTVVFFVGVATVRRLLMLNRDDYVTVVGMNRLRHGYLELHPELEQNFTTSHHDDLTGALRTLGVDAATRGGVGSFSHRAVTLPGMVGVVVSAVGASIGGLAAVGLGAPIYAVILVGAAAFVVTELLIMRTARHSFRGYGPGIEPRFPTPKS